MSMHGSKRALMLAALFASVSPFLIGTAHAEAAAAAAESANDGLSEIVVTAQKRETNVQRTPVAISVATSESLEARRVKSLADLADGSIPSLRIAQFFTRNSAFNIGIRGIFPTSDANQPARDTAIGVYIDGVYLGRPQGLGAALYDIERIEVLKGPQGTLFGRNSTGGAVSIVTRKPSGEFDLRQTLGIRNFGGYSSETHMDLPAIANVSLKFDAVFSKREGTVENPASGQPGYGSYDRRGFHARALWAPSETFSADYNFDVSYDATTPNYLQYVDFKAASGSWSPIVRRQTSRPKVAEFGIPFQESIGNISGHSLNLTWKPMTDLEVRSITSYRNMKQTQFDNTGVSAFLYSATNNFLNQRFARYSLATMHQDQFSQEIQAVGSLPRINYVAGLYYYSEEGSDDAWSPFTMIFTSANGASYANLGSIAAGATSAFPDRASRAKTRSHAAYAQLSWNPPILQDKARLTIGARYTNDKKSGALYLINGAAYAGTFTGEWSRVDPAVTVSYDATDDVHIYAKWGTAYRAGGANSRSLTYRAFGPEEVKTSEIGVKSEFWDRRARLNLAAFSTDYEGFQIDFNKTVPGTTRTIIDTTNSPRPAKIKGFEADFTIMPISNLTLTASYAYTKGEVPPYVEPSTKLVTPTGIVYTPKNAYSLGADYRIPFNNFTVLAHLDASFADGYRVGADPILAPKTDRSKVVNGRLAVTDLQLGGGHDLTLSLWARNLLNEEYLTYKAFAWSNTARTVSATSGIFNEPRTFGLDLTLKY